MFFPLEMREYGKIFLLKRKKRTGKGTKSLFNDEFAFVFSFAAHKFFITFLPYQQKSKGKGKKPQKIFFLKILCLVKRTTDIPILIHYE